MSGLNIRAIDVGYGNVKCVTGRAAGEMTTKIFPSFAPRASATNLAGDFVRQRENKRVTLNGIVYEVGVDSKLALKGTELGRSLREDYCLSDQYAALVFGGLMHMGRLSSLDILALGLPVNLYQNFKEPLAKRFTGRFDIGEKTFSIEKVLVLPQPLGGFYDFAVANKILRGMSRETTLVVDPGYCTLDFLVSEGTTPIDARSGARPHGGMAQVMKAVMEAIATDAGVSIADLGNSERYDNDLREGRSIKFAGVELNKRGNADYIKIAQGRALDPFTELLDTVGSRGDIDRVLVVGGGAHVYYDLVKQAFPHHEVQVASNPILSNVRGFQMLAELWAKKNIG